MRAIVVAGIVFALGVTPAMSQSRRVYVSALGGIDAGARGPLASTALPTMGGSVGLRLSDGWSLEGEVERGFYTRQRSDEGLWLSRVGAGATREELERNGVFARFDRVDRARLGWSVAAVWKSRAPGRVNAALFAGIGSRSFDKRTVRTVTAVGPDVDPSPSNPDLRPDDTIETVTGGGLTSGFRVLFRTSAGLSLGPEFRYTAGVIDDQRYNVVRLAGRLAWRF